MNVFLVQNKNVKNGFCNYDVDYSIKKERQFQTMMRVELKSLSTSDDVGMHDCNFLWYSNFEHDDGCGRKKNTAIIFICHSFLICQYLAPWGLSAECVQVSVM